MNIRLNINILILGISIILSGCTQMSFQTYKQEAQLKDNTSIVLLRIKGHRTVNYLQFMSNSKFPPAFNYRGLAVTNDIIALRVPTPQENFYFGVFTAGQAGYMTYGDMTTSYGYISVKSDSININKQGMYFYGVLDTDKEAIIQSIDQDSLDLIKEKYKNLLKNLKPINFELYKKFNKTE